MASGTASNAGAAAAQAAAGSITTQVLFCLVEITSGSGVKTYAVSGANPLTEDQAAAVEKYGKAALARPSYSAENARLIEERKGFMQQIEQLQAQVAALEAAAPKPEVTQ